MAFSQKMRNHYVRATVICSLPVLFYLYEFAIRTMPSAMTNDLMRDLHITAAGLGILSSFFYYGYTAMQIPVGLLYDRFGARFLLTVSMGFCAFGTLLFGLSNNIFIANMAYLIVGFASSFAFIGSLVLAARWFPPRHFAMIVGLIQFLGCLGAILGIAPVVKLTESIGWHYTVYWFVALGLVIFVLMALLVKNQPPEGECGTKLLKPKAKLTELQRLKVVCKNVQTWWIALYAFAIWAPIVIFAGLWGLPFLVERYTVDPSSAAIGITVLWLGVAIGGPIVGWWSNYIGSRRIPAAFCAILAIITAVLLIYIDGFSWMTSCVILFLFGAAASGQALSFGIVQDTHPPSVVGTAVGFNNMAVIVSGAFLQPVVGIILKYHWAGEIANGAPVYSLGDYRAALFCLPVCGVIGLITSLFFIKETRCMFQYEDEGHQHSGLVSGNAV